MKYWLTACCMFPGFFLMTAAASGQPLVKQPNVSGQFYNDNPRELSREIEQYFSLAKVNPSSKKIRMMVSPHAGYAYSGQVAAYGFKAASKEHYSTIVILAPSHFMGFDGISIWKEGGFQTPLGVAPVDREITQKLLVSNEKFYFEPRAFEKEHSLEVEIPFLQKTFKDFKIVPVIFGQPAPDTLRAFAESLHNIIGARDDVLIVVSTDLSHYHNDQLARQMDARAMEAIKSLKAEEVWQEAGITRTTMEMCGFVPVTAALLYARLKGLNDVEILNYANSGDVNGDYNRVVGYTSIVFYDSSDNKSGSLNIQQKRRLLEIARKTIDSFVGSGKKYEVNESDLRLLAQKEGAFVTIHNQGHLRGCIGHIVNGEEPLCYLVRDMAIAAASEDPRFEPVKKEELDKIDVEISVLSSPGPIESIDEIILGTHGVIVSKGRFHQGVFLPQVATETGWSKEKFLSELCAQKAGLPVDCFKDPDTTFEIFTADVFSERDFKP